MNPGDGVRGSFFEPRGRGYGFIFVAQAYVFSTRATDIVSGGKSGRLLCGSRRQFF